MTIRTAKIYTCDRCGKKDEKPMGEGSPYLWGRLTLDQPERGESMLFDLCDSCLAWASSWAAALSGSAGEPKRAEDYVDMIKASQGQKGYQWT